MEERIFQFTIWVKDQQERFYQEIINTKNPRKSFESRTVKFYGKLVTAGQKILDDYRYDLDRPEMTQLANRLQHLSEGTLDEINRRLLNLSK